MRQAVVIKGFFRLRIRSGSSQGKLMENQRKNINGKSEGKFLVPSTAPHKPIVTSHNMLQRLYNSREAFSAGTATISTAFKKM